MKYAWMPFAQSGSISVWITAYGIGPSRSATGSAAARNSPNVGLALLDRTGGGGDERRDLLAVPLLPGSPAAAARS